MANNYFQFKEFWVNQEGATMKVCTDSCLFGAWVASHLENAETILDAGSGTGLLSLMLKQKLPAAAVWAVEKDPDSARQSEQNFQLSPWSNSMKVETVCFENFHPPFSFDLVISNPPFYKNSLPSPKGAKSLAMHENSISLQQWLAKMNDLLSPGGTAALLLPFHRKNELMKLAAEMQLMPYRMAKVRQSDAHDYFRVMVLFSSDDRVVIEEDISIREGTNYSAAFVELLKPYYLHL